MQEQVLLLNIFYLFPINDLLGLIRTLNLDIAQYFPNYIYNLIKTNSINNCYWIYNIESGNSNNYIHLGYVYNSIIYMTDIMFDIMSFKFINYKNFNNIYNISQLKSIQNYILAQKFLISLN